MIYSKEKIAKRLKDERNNAELTQLELSKKLKYSKPTVIEWERSNGENRIPDMDTLLKMCNLYNCEIGYLLGEYDTRFRRNATVQEETGLSEAAIESLRRYGKEPDYIEPGIPAPTPSDFLSFLLTYSDDGQAHFLGSYALDDILEQIGEIRNNNDLINTMPPTFRDICTRAFENAYKTTRNPFEARDVYFQLIRMDFTAYSKQLLKETPGRSDLDFLGYATDAFYILEEKKQQPLMELNISNTMLSLIKEYIDQIDG